MLGRFKKSGAQKPLKNINNIKTHEKVFFSKNEKIIQVEERVKRMKEVVEKSKKDVEALNEEINNTEE